MSTRVVARLGRPLVVALAFLLALGAAVAPAALPGAPGTARADAAQVFPIGSGPLDDVLAAAGEQARCGLSQEQLAAVMLAVVFYEAGYSATRAPSPMTLGRWDNQSYAVGLYAFGDKATPYQRAYFHAGIGLWQFDSAGAYPLTAAGAIDTRTAAAEAASQMSRRYCNSTAADPVDRIRAAWSPWYACKNNDRCLNAYNDIFDGTRLRNLTRQPNVTSTGGMQARTCTMQAVAVTCHLVDPGRAEGYNDWAIPSYGRPDTAPISAPFYVISRDGREHRVWNAQDTGYPMAIAADKPITANARTSLTWSTGRLLCDQTAGRGQCVPIGSFDGVSGGAGAVNVRGWGIDPEVASSIKVHVYVDGRFSGEWPANAVRGDVGTAYPGYGHDHGFDVTINGVAAGDREVCTYLINVGAGDDNPFQGCRTVSVAPGPPGFWDVPPSHPFLTAISWMKATTISTGYDDGSYRPRDGVSRGAMAAFMQRLYQVMGAPAVGGGGGFTDVAPGHPFEAAISWMQATGISTGYADGTFRPGELVSRQAMAAFMARFYRAVGGSPAGGELPTDVGAGHPFAADIAWLMSSGVSTGYADGTFRPGELVSRQAMAAFLQRLADLPR